MAGDKSVHIPISLKFTEWFTQTKYKIKIKQAICQVAKQESKLFF